MHHFFEEVTEYDQCLFAKTALAMHSGKQPVRCSLARRGYFSISSQVQPNEKGQYPDTYLNIGGGKWSKGVAFINGFNLVRP